ncbi:src kinase-associated phosphoprotein 2-like [Ruditapes philippinarum]|uniref:src kinase-associated phosphoprotein 2-like n=1 Tax=Ruditapes philippinarum TaxID=129788 RepID=UPI00295A755F|nr:src kinase-associated phosphoprotein 2-like [Ruditapes philippinarum]
MSLFHENMKQLLSEVDKFLNDTLKKDAKLSKKTLEHKQLILDKLAKFYEENPQMKLVPSQDSISAKDPDEASLTGSSRSDENEDGNYNDAGIGLISATDLNNPVLTGFLEKKQKKGIFGGGKFQKRWCIAHAGNFYYYTSAKDKQQNGSFRLEGYKFRNAPDLSSKKAEKELCFELYHEYTGKRVYQFMAKNKTEYEQWQNALENEGHPLIEEDIYEEVGADDPSAGMSNIKPTVQPEKPSIEEEPVAEDEYEDPDAKPGAPPVPPSIKGLHKLPPPPPLSTSPALKSKVEDHVKAQPEPAEPDELYDDATSVEAAKKTEPPTPPRGRPQPPEPVEAPPQPPEVPPPVKRGNRPQRNLPPPPPEKKKIKLNITCKPEEDFENRYFGKWDCTGDSSSELSFKKGDIIYILSREFDEKSWWVGELNGKFGLVPKNFLTAAYSPVA